MNKSKKIISILQDVIEKYIPMVAFLLLFLSFILQIFYRYVLNAPLKWTYEVTVIGYIWVALMGACYAMRTNENVAFTMLYDKWSEAKQRIARIVGNLLLLITYIVLFIPSYEYIDFMKIKKTTVLRIPLNIVFFPFLIFVSVVVIYTIIELYKDVKTLIQRQKSDK